MRFAGISSRTRPLRYESDVHLAPTPYKSDAHALLHCPGTLLTQQLATGDIAPSIGAPQGSRARSQGQRRQAAAPPRIPRSRRTARIPRDQQRPPRAPAASCAPRAPLPSSCQTRGIPAAPPAPALGDCFRAAIRRGSQRFVRTSHSRRALRPILLLRLWRLGSHSRRALRPVLLLRTWRRPSLGVRATWLVKQLFLSKRLKRLSTDFPRPPEEGI